MKFINAYELELRKSCTMFLEMLSRLSNMIMRIINSTCYYLLLGTHCVKTFTFYVATLETSLF